MRRVFLELSLDLFGNNILLQNGGAAKQILQMLLLVSYTAPLPAQAYTAPMCTIVSTCSPTAATINVFHTLWQVYMVASLIFLNSTAMLSWRLWPVSENWNRAIHGVTQTVSQESALFFFSDFTALALQSPPACDH